MTCSLMAISSIVASRDKLDKNSSTPTIPVNPATKVRADFWSTNFAILIYTANTLFIKLLSGISDNNNSIKLY